MQVCLIFVSECWQGQGYVCVSLEHPACLWSDGIINQEEFYLEMSTSQLYGSTDQWNQLPCCVSWICRFGTRGRWAPHLRACGIARMCVGMPGILAWVRCDRGVSLRVWGACSGLLEGFLQRVSPNSLSGSPHVGLRFRCICVGAAVCRILGNQYT